MEKMTVTRALAELKLLDARINKEIVQATFADVYQSRADKALKTNTTKEVFEKEAKAKYESITSLIARRNSVKGAILKSNASTKVKIDGKEFTVIEAIDRKSSVVYEKTLLAQMKSIYTRLLNEVITNKATLDSQVQQMLSQNLGADKKASKDDFEAIAKPFIEANELKLLDPLSLKTKIDVLDKAIDTFETEVDFVLSESNSKTEIEF